MDDEAAYGVLATACIGAIVMLTARPVVHGASVLDVDFILVAVLLVVLELSVRRLAPVLGGTVAPAFALLASLHSRNSKLLIVMALLVVPVGLGATGFIAAGLALIIGWRLSRTLYHASVSAVPCRSIISNSIAGNRAVRRCIACGV